MNLFLVFPVANRLKYLNKLPKKSSIPTMKPCPSLEVFKKNILSLDVTEAALNRLTNQSKREFDGADLSVLDSFQIKRPLYHKGTNSFSIIEEEPCSALSNPQDKIISKADRYNWLFLCLKEASSREYSAVTQIKNIVGKNGRSFHLFGMLTGSVVLTPSNGRRKDSSRRQG